MQIKNDYSYLFSNIGTSNKAGVANSSFLADYASIKNGSYGKLMKAYYGKNNANVSGIVSDKNTSTSPEAAKKLAEISENADSVEEAAAKLVDRGSKSLFKKTEITTKDENGVETTKMGYDTDAIYKGVKSFVDSYNKLIDSTKETSSKNIERQTQNLMKSTSVNERLLGQLGITIGKDNKLTVDEDTFKKADMGTAKTVFNGTGSFAYNVQAKAAMIDYTAGNEAKKANTYNASGSFSNNFNNGNIYNSFF